MRTTHPPHLSTGTRVHVRSDHFAGQCDGIITACRYDEGWLYRLDVTAGDRLEEHRNERGELWVCDFEIRPIEAREACALR